MQPPFNLPPTQFQINGTTTASPSQQVMPSNHHQGYSSNSLPNYPQIQPQLGGIIDPRIPNTPISIPLPPFINSSPNHPFPFQNAMPLPPLGPSGQLPHPGQFISEFRPQNLNSMATNQSNYSGPKNQLFGVDFMNLAPNFNQILGFPNGQYGWQQRQIMPMSQQLIPVQTPNYTHFVPGYHRPVSRATAPQNATLIPAQQFGPVPTYPLAQQAQNFWPVFTAPPQKQKQEENRLKMNGARSSGGGGAEKHKNKTKSKNRKNKRRKKQQEKESEAPTAGVNAADLEKQKGSTKDAEKLMSLETESAETKDNLVLRKLLRGPRYFDPAVSCGQVCYKCGSNDHEKADCNMQKRKKPCFICGRFDHSGKRWKKGKGGFNCNISHLVKDCLEKDPIANDNYRICLKCGDSGHSMFSCNNDYAPDDLKKIKCYICNDFGHLCCAEYVDEGPRQVSCYKCGEFGHLGAGCPKRQGQPGGLEAANLCDSGGEKDHIAIDCQKSAKEDEYIGELATVEEEEEEDHDQVGTEICKSLLKQKDATQGNSASVLVQV